MKNNEDKKESPSEQIRKALLDMQASWLNHQEVYQRSMIIITTAAHDIAVQESMKGTNAPNP